MIAQAILVQAVHKLRAAGVPDPARDARILLASAMGIPVDRLTLHLQDDCDDTVFEAFERLVAQRETRQPVSQIIGRRSFYGRDFVVTPDVLDPRPETETLVVEALSVPFGSVLDMGTGSGCLLATLLAERSDALGVGVDVSTNALEIAQQNANNLGVADRAQFIRSDWFNGVEGSYDLIVSNPPYIDEQEWQTLDPEPKNWEPKIALTPGPDGLVPYRILAEQASEILNDGGWLMVEIGWQQGQAVSKRLSDHSWLSVEVISDMDGRDRVVKGQKPAKPLQRGQN